MDMNDFSDPIFADLGQSEFIGGIDHERLDFNQSFIPSPSNNNNNNNSSDNILACAHKTVAPPTTATPPTNAIAASGTRVNHTSAPIATPTALQTTAAIINSQATPQLPESPPDSSSEPPYSPLQDEHGLTLTSRSIYNGLPALQQATTSSELHMQQQFTTPHQQNEQAYSHHHFPLSNMQNHLNNSHTIAPTLAAAAAAATHHPQGLNGSVRVKHEAGLIINPSTLATHLPSSNLLSPHHSLNDTQIDIAAHPLMFSNNNIGHYDALANGFYPTTNYQNVAAVVGGVGSLEATPSCMLTSLDDVSRVQVVGTSQIGHVQVASAPSTPIHPPSRKRKMSTHLDCADYANIKPDPGLAMSPMPQHHGLATDAHKQLSPTSPVSITMPTLNNDMSHTPAHSAASLSPALSTINTNPDSSMDCSAASIAPSNGETSSDANALSRCIRFSPFQTQNWHKLCDQSLQELAVVYYRVDADKGFNYSSSDEAFVCQKKNHFQITCHARLQGDAKFVKTPSGLEKIKSFHLHFYGVKWEAPNQTIRVEQSQSDRSKKPFYPVPIDLQSHIVSKITVGRLHFSETTNNNMRKKGRPNPEQRYFQLVVGLHVHTMSGNFPVVSQGSEQIIVRASNPGQFESDIDPCWQRGLTKDSIFHAGPVGIGDNTESPDERLVVHGNIKLSGHLVHPSDSRAKQEIGELDTSVQLRNLQKIRIVRYRYQPEFAIHAGLKRRSSSDINEIIDTGVIAQEVREVIPDAVQEAGSIVLPDGSVIENFLLVNKDRIFMENIGAVKELCKVTGSLENRIEDLERVNNLLIREKVCEQRSTLERNKKTGLLRNGDEMCSNRTLQIIIFLLVIVMAFCLAAVSTLYFVEHNKQHHLYKQLDSMQLLGNSRFYGRDSVLVSDQGLHLTHNYRTTSRTPYRTLLRNNTRIGLISYDVGEDPLSAAIRHNEGLQVTEIEKPAETVQIIKEPFKITTSSPLLYTNKTIGSKNKSKLPQGVVRTTQTQVIRTDIVLPIAIENEETPTNSETSSEKIAEPISLTQDVENNSIDIDAQRVSKKSPVSNTLVAALFNEALPAQLPSGTDNVASTSSSNSLNVPDTTATSNNLKLNLEDPINAYNAYKTSAQSANFSIESSPISNKSQGVSESTIDNSDAFDLQTLSSNDSADNPKTDFIGYGGGRESTLGRRSAAQRIQLVATKTIKVDTFGAPVQCLQETTRDDISNCQSVCFEDSNQLPPLRPQLDSKKINDRHQQSVDAGDIDSGETEADEGLDAAIQSPLLGAAEDTNTNISTIAAGKTSYPTVAIAKQLSDEQQSEDADTVEKYENSDEQLAGVGPKIDVNKNLPLTPNLSIEVHRPPDLDCWKIANNIIVDNLNQTFGYEDFCPNNGKSLNLTYIIPLSRFFNKQSVELHLSSSIPLQWTICNNNEHTKRNGKPLVNSHVQPHSTKTLQRRQNTSILFLNIPSRGYFISELDLRATSDLAKSNICEEEANEANPLLQYNFRIIRDCD